MGACGSLADVQSVIYNVCVLVQLCTKARCSYSPGLHTVSMLEPNNNKQVLPTAAILEQITEGAGGALAAGGLKTGPGSSGVSVAVCVVGFAGGSGSAALAA